MSSGKGGNCYMGKKKWLLFCVPFEGMVGFILNSLQRKIPLMVFSERESSGAQPASISHRTVWRERFWVEMMQNYSPRCNGGSLWVVGSGEKRGEVWWEWGSGEGVTEELSPAGKQSPRWGLGQRGLWDLARVWPLPVKVPKTFIKDCCVTRDSSLGSGNSYQS